MRGICIRRSEYEEGIGWELSECEGEEGGCELSECEGEGGCEREEGKERGERARYL